ncbi:hypothetical protein [Marinococcus halophilus]|uniref:hypothetical protein n=1 Tax=Marinococcus halophilus TaxID=1371 RepID=UPI0009A5D65B|nr:hypothetical protein [Marinococcus halophilus]
MNENLWFLVELFSFLFLFAGGMALTMMLTRRWYVKRNGQDRSQNYANEAHRKVSLGFVVVAVFVLIPSINLDMMPPRHWSFLFIVFPFCLLYVGIGTYLWKNESSNKDDYRYDWWILGGILVWSMLIMSGMQWLGV